MKEDNRKTIFLIVLGIMIGAAIIGISTFLFFRGDYDTADQEGAAMTLWTIGFLIGGAIFMKSIKAVDNEKDRLKKEKERIARDEEEKRKKEREQWEEEEKKKIEEKKKEAEMRRKKAEAPVDIYKECDKRSITSLALEPEKEGLLLIARKYGITEYEEAEQMFYLGKEKVEKKEEEVRKAKEEKIQREKWKELNAQKQKEAKIIIDQKQQADIAGIEKYTDAINKEILSKQMRCDDAEKKIEEIQKRGKELADLKQQTIQMEARAYVQTRLEGGRYAGSIAGIVNEHEANKKLQRNERLFNAGMSAINEEHSKVYAGYSDLVAQKKHAQEYMDNCRKQLDILSDKLLDDSNPEKKLEKLTFRSFKCSLSITGNIEVTATSEVNSDVYIATSAGWLDGSLKLTVKDKDNTPVAVGYYATKFEPWGYSAEVKLSSCTFGSKHGDKTNISAICVPIDGKSVASPKGLSVQVEPVHMWIIEK